jgi:protein-tyrosine phosphatase
MISQITDQIWIGDQVDALNEDLYKLYKFDFVLNLNDRHVEDEFRLLERLGIKWIHYPTPTKELLKEASESLEYGVNHGERCLVHCEAGIDRAPFVVALCLARMKHLPLNKAYNIVKYYRRYVTEHYEWV